MLQKIKDKQLEKILNSYDEYITGMEDLCGDKEPSLLFYFLIKYCGYLLKNEPEEVLSREGILRRRNLHSIIRKLGPAFLSTKQIFEKGSLSDIAELPEEPVIWCSNHAFKDDALASILAAKRHAYILFGSLPQFFNTIDGVTAYLNGVVMVNRKVASSRRASMAKALKVMEYGTDLLVYPEGVWNKTPEKLLLDFWPGIYRISCETGSKVVPMVHYLKDCAHKMPNNDIYSKVLKPVRIDDLSEKAALEYLREIMGTEYFNMLEKYGKSTREEELSEYEKPEEFWAKQVDDRIRTASRYDAPIEFTADYRLKEKVTPAQAWKAIGGIRNISIDNVKSIVHARKALDDWEKWDFQHRF